MGEAGGGLEALIYKGSEPLSLPWTSKCCHYQRSLALCLREQLYLPVFCHAHRRRAEDFTRRRGLSFVMLVVLCW